ncbi:hypothetical protein [Vibrio cholerae]|uniref:hypothetical protein n=1 Tax=Vibrio cholerae TaxID=666 RepID=UPI00115A591D|nr:hypothetical protein [Vibrio cholerae]EJL6626742.1 hypothetical protein [Vibrio cholerae]EJL6739355.1 hypothetical protein [Vibrio cholerae]TQO87803.1 hypothetical protein FLM05_11310 [Vibrio cholerae]TQP03137.1 hypothetical protein FLM07_07210 [Vibrio cholerae]TQP58385.1 hypothetical protein FLL95_12065 [Vibrio cholerae]
MRPPRLGDFIAEATPSRIIPFLLEVVAVLATFVHPNHIVYLCSWGLTHSLAADLQHQVVWV